MALSYYPRKDSAQRKTRKIVRLVVGGVLLIAAFAGHPLFIPQGQTGQARVIDGDTIDLDGQRIRLYGLDAPEMKQSCTLADGPYACGEKAKEALSSLIAGQDVRCEKRDIDRYNRIVGVCYSGGTDINAWMVAQGYAVAYRQYSMRYAPQEAEAKHAKRGIWAGSFDMPSDFRRAKREITGRKNATQSP